MRAVVHERQVVDQRGLGLEMAKAQPGAGAGAGAARRRDCSNNPENPWKGLVDWKRERKVIRRYEEGFEHAEAAKM